MARKRLEDLLVELRSVPADPHGEGSLRLLRGALAGPSPHGAARAAKLAGELGIPEVAPELEQAFERWRGAGVADAGCAAKTAIARSLDRLEHAEPRVFLAGIRHVQMEGAYGEPIDTATELRGLCGLALVRMGYRDALDELADLLADREAHARAAAARALGLRGGEGAIALLRFKVRSGDEQPDVVCECLTALLAVAPRSSLALACSLLEGRLPALCEAAALALGASRLAEAFEPLREWHERTRGSEREATALLALATVRHERAVEYLLVLLGEGSAATAERAIQALALYRGEETLRERARQAVSSRGDARLLEAVRRSL